MLVDPHDDLWKVVLDSEPRELQLRRIDLSHIYHNAQHDSRDIKSFYLSDTASLFADFWPMVLVVRPGELGQRILRMLKLNTIPPVPDTAPPGANLDGTRRLGYRRGWGFCGTRWREQV